MCILRVTVRDDDLSKLRYSREWDVEAFLKTRYLPIFANGIQLCGRKFDFLGYSTSALRDHSTWFVTPFTQADGSSVDAESIRRALGDFSKVRSPVPFPPRIF